MWIVIGIIAIVVFLLIRMYNRTNGYYEVIDNKGKSRTLGNYEQCLSWIKAQKGMESLAGIQSNYTIKKKKF